MLDATIDPGAAENTKTATGDMSHCLLGLKDGTPEIRMTSRYPIGRGVVLNGQIGRQIMGDTERTR